MNSITAFYGSAYLASAAWSSSMQTSRALGNLFAAQRYHAASVARVTSAQERLAAARARLHRVRAGGSL
jgi:hypothetical protein